MSDFSFTFSNNGIAYNPFTDPNATAAANAAANKCNPGTPKRKGKLSNAIIGSAINPLLGSNVESQQPGPRKPWRHTHQLSSCRPSASLPLLTSSPAVAPLSGAPTTSLLHPTHPHQAVPPQTLASAPGQASASALASAAPAQSPPRASVAVAATPPPPALAAAPLPSTKRPRPALFEDDEMGYSQEELVHVECVSILRRDQSSLSRASSTRVLFGPRQKQILGQPSCKRQNIGRHVPVLQRKEDYAYGRLGEGSWLRSSGNGSVGLGWGGGTNFLILS